MASNETEGMPVRTVVRSEYCLYWDVKRMDDV